jgi:V/A-type H+/Na+-transporting ATPase subunit I
MASAELLPPGRMSRVAVVSPRTRARDVLVELARAGCVELVGNLPPAEGEEAEALRRLRNLVAESREPPALLLSPPEVSGLERRKEIGLLAGETELKRRTRLAVEHGSFSAWVGWAPTARLDELGERLAEADSGLVELPRPAWVDPPTLFRPTAVERPFRPLVRTYGTPRYWDVDPTAFAAASFVVMFGMMFGDVGHGLVLALLGLWLRRRREGRFADVRDLWVIVFACGLAGVCFGLLYGEAFGPTQLVPRLWLDPVERPIPLFLVALSLGGVLLAVSYLFGIVNRGRESGLARALLDQSGIAGLMIFVGGGIFTGGLYWHLLPAEILGGVIAAAGTVLLGTGLALQVAGGAAAVIQVGIEVFDAVTRIVSNFISFARLAAFGLMHAALGAVVFAAAAALWGGVVGGIAAVTVFIVGNVVAFSLEALVTGVQALRLEYYELFSRIFSGEGHAFAPWSMPVLPIEEEK